MHQQHKNNSKRCTSLLILLFPLCILLTASDIQHSFLKIESIKTSKTPVINDNKLIYTADVTFNERPKNYWSYFDKTSYRIVIDCYDTHLDSLPANIQKNYPFQGFEINNTEAKKTVTGKIAKFSLSLDSIWHYKCEPEGDYDLKITVWKEFSEPVIKKEKKNPIVAYLAVAGLTGALTLAIILLTTQQ